MSRNQKLQRQFADVVKAAHAAGYTQGYQQGYREGYNEHAKSRAKSEQMFGQFGTSPPHEGIPDNAWHP